MGVFGQKKLGFFRVTSILIICSFVGTNITPVSAFAKSRDADTSYLSPTVNFTNRDIETAFSLLINEQLDKGSLQEKIAKENNESLSHAIDLTYTFRLKDSFAQAVFIVGSFNSWKENDAAFAFKRVNNDEWELTIPSFAVGTEYKIIVDGAWYIDQNNPVRLTTQINREGAFYHTDNSVFLAEQRYANVEKVLREIGQEHLFQEWAPLGEDQQGKTEFYEQILKGNRNAPHGLRIYCSDAQSELKKAIRGENPFEGYAPFVPEGVQIGINEELLRLEQVGLAHASNLVVTMVAGGVGDRLGYKQPKVLIPLSLVDEQRYILMYINTILAMQEKSTRVNGAKVRIPFVIMTSEDTHNGTIQFLREMGYSYREVRDERHGTYQYINSYVEMVKGDSLIQIVTQGTVPALIDTQARFASDKDNPYKIQEKPHGHGDVHMLLKDSGLAQRWLEEGKTHMVFIQDTNAQVANAILPGLAVSLEHGFDMNFLTVPREAGEAAGSIALLKSEENRPEKVGNVEYNQLDPLLKAVFRAKVAENVISEIGIPVSIYKQAKSIIVDNFTLPAKAFEDLKAVTSLSLDERGFFGMMSEAALAVGETMNVQQDKVIVMTAEELIRQAMTYKHARETARQLKISNGNMEKAVALIAENTNLSVIVNALLELEPKKDISADILMDAIKKGLMQVNEFSQITLGISFTNENTIVTRDFVIPNKFLNQAIMILKENLSDADKAGSELSRFIGERIGKRMVDMEIVRSALKNSGDVPDRQTGKSPFPGNLNVFIMKMDAYMKTLDQTNGIMPEFINPKFDKEKTGFKPTRLETMMQDIAFLMNKVGVTNFQEKRLVFSPVKNSTDEAMKKQKAGNYPDHMATGEADYYMIRRMFLALSGVDIAVAGQETLTDGGIKFQDGAQVVWTPRSALTVEELRRKFLGGTITSRATLFWNGENVTFKNPLLDGALLVDVTSSAKVSLSNVMVKNRGMHVGGLEAGDADYLLMRGYKLNTRQKAEIIVDGTGPLVLDGVECVGDVKIVSHYDGATPVGLNNMRLVNKLVIIDEEGVMTFAPISEDMSMDMLTGIDSARILKDFVAGLMIQNAI